MLVHVLVFGTDPGLILLHPVLTLRLYELPDGPPMLEDASAEFVGHPDVDDLALSLRIGKLEPLDRFDDVTPWRIIH